MAATMAERIGPSEYAWGDPWIHGDGNPPQQIVRNLKTNVQFSRLFNNSLILHQRGRAIGNFYYRIKSSFSSLKRFTEFQISVIRHLVDYDSDEHDLQDLRDAIERSIKPGETNVLNRVNEVWEEMDDVTVDPPQALR